MSIAILAYGSLIDEPGPELGNLIADRLFVHTPFPVEFAKYSRGRGNAATLVPFDTGRRVAARLLVLTDGTELDQAKDMLYHREIDKFDQRTYRDPSSRPKEDRRKRVRIRTLTAFSGVRTVLYTDFYATSKIRLPKAMCLARRAVKSVMLAERERDGITYLMRALNNGVETALSREYEKEILRQTNAKSLGDALADLLAKK